MEKFQDAEIQPCHLNLTDLFHRRLFRIPQYQRAYGWQTRHRRDLFDDIIRSWSAGSSKNHFMATVVGLHRKTQTIATNEYSVLDIVDGQQRLTTLIILLKATSRNAALPENVANDISDTLVKPDDASLLLLQTNQDNSGYFSDYIRDGTVISPDEAKTSADRELLLAIQECEKFVSEWQEAGHRLDDLGKSLEKSAQLYISPNRKGRNVYTVFEVLNSRGLDVSWLDRLKSMLMAVIFDSENTNKHELISEVHQVWSAIYHTIGLRLGLSTESLRFSATLNATDCPSRPLGQEDAARQLLGQSAGGAREVIKTSKWIKSVTKAVDSLA